MFNNQRYNEQRDYDGSLLYNSTDIVGKPYHDKTLDAWGHAILPNKPYDYTNTGKAIFTTSQLAWGYPEDFGWSSPYEVIEQEQPLALNYSDEINLPKLRPVHRYCRRERFKTVLAQLMGYTGFATNKQQKLNLPDKIKNILPRNIKYTPKSQMWETVREALKEHRYHIYYNRIPAILASLSMIQYKIFANEGKFSNILADFDRMHQVFAKIKHTLHRKYFPSLRYVALRLMEKHNVRQPFEIPLTRTVQKRAELAEIYDAIWSYITNQEALEVLQFFEDQ